MRGNRHPFLLSNLAGAILALSILPIVVIYLPETKDLKKRVTEEREARGRWCATEGLVLSAVSFGSDKSKVEVEVSGLSLCFSVRG